MDGENLVSPYVVKAIGDPTYLDSGLTLKNYGYMDLIKSENKTGVLERQNDIIIYAYNKDLGFSYAEEVKSE